MTLEGIHLSFNVHPDVGLVNRKHISNSSRVFGLAIAVDWPACKCSVVSCALSETIQPLSTISLCSRPLANNQPFVGLCNLVANCTRSLYMLLWRTGDLVVTEDLIVVVVKNYVVLL